ncbi:unnamed protein product [Coffea canephora]|uniref:DH200=94 genomic scaffold, scaffold_7676 n=1 Tax=Coffea canephora TaxID=49390 RepID=A0A068VMS6_COFCA|nr:unnamed protein product [Coffea canephora]
MVEGGVSKAGRIEFTECWRTIWKTPYIMRLALSTGIGGLLFGYDTGNPESHPTHPPRASFTEDCIHFYSPLASTTRKRAFCNAFAVAQGESAVNKQQISICAANFTTVPNFYIKTT